MRYRLHERVWKLDPEWGRAPWRASPDRIERVLHVHLATDAEPQLSLCQSLASLASCTSGYRRVEWTSLQRPERDAAVLEAAREHRPTLVFMQLQRPEVLATETVAQLRKLANGRDQVVMSWCGDVGGTNGPFPAPNDRWAYDLAKHCDLMLYSSLSQVRAHRSRSMHNAAYLQIGYDEGRYFEGVDSGYGRMYTVAFMGSRYEDRHWKSLPTHEAKLRRTLAASMTSQFGARFGLFGTGWGAGVSELSPVRSGDVYRCSALALSISLCSDLERYTSDRLLRALACGSPVLMRTFKDWGSYGLQHGVNVLAFESADDAVALALEWLRPERREELREIGRRGAALAREHHSWGVRMLELQPLVSAARGVSMELSRPW